jgi:hypothetical protein
LPNGQLVGVADTAGPVTPVPESATVVGLPDALLAIFTEADFAPVPGGWNTTPIAQVPPGSTAEQLLLAIANAGVLAPVSVTPLTVSAAVPVFFTAIDCAALVVPPTWLPNDRLVGLADMPGVPAGQVARVAGMPTVKP